MAHAGKAFVFLAAMCLSLVTGAEESADVRVVPRGFPKHVTEGGIVYGEYEFELAIPEDCAPGSMSAEEYDEFVRDTTNFLAFIAEPIRQDRRTLGVWVLIFLVFFLILATQLKKEIWKDVK